MTEQIDNEVKRRRGIYLLPNLFTTAALFAGFYAIINGMNGHFEASAIAIFIAMVLDGLDGRVARLTNTQSDFGEQYDSLADLVSFGLAPALVMYEWALADMGKLGWLAAFIYTASAALRLARFNAMIGSQDKRYFTGLPSPSAAAVVAGLVWVAMDNQLPGNQLKWVAFGLTIAIGLLMVSNIRYRSFKDLDLKGKVPFMAVLLVMLVYVLITIDPPQVLFSLFAAYAISGLVGTLLRIRKIRRERHKDNEAS